MNKKTALAFLTAGIVSLIRLADSDIALADQRGRQDHSRRESARRAIKIAERFRKIARISIRTCANTTMIARLCNERTGAAPAVPKSNVCATKRDGADAR